jgi:hypothetical protein
MHHCGHDGAPAHSSRDVLRYLDKLCGLRGLPISLLPIYTCGATSWVSFTPNGVARGTICRMSLKRLGRQYIVCLTSFRGPGIPGATGLSYALTAMVGRLNISCKPLGTG